MMVHNDSLVPSRKCFYFIPTYILRSLPGSFTHRLAFNAVIGINENYIRLNSCP